MSVADFDASVVKAAEATLARVAAAREAIGAVIFGQERVVEQTLVTLLAGGHGLVDRRPRPRQDQAGRDARHRHGPRRAARAVHARSDALRHSRRRGDGGRARPLAQLPLHQGADLRPTADGRRDQPRQPAHAVGAAAGDAGASRHGRRRAARSAGPVPRAGDAEPAGAGGRLSRCPRRSSTAS